MDAGESEGNPRRCIARGLRRARPRVLPALALVLLVGCSSSSGGGGAGSGTDTSGSHGASGRPADPGTTREVAHAYAALFGSGYTQAQSRNALQHGTAFAATIRKESTSTYAKKSSAKVSSVRLLGADLAQVTFTIKSNGAVVLPGANGKAVREGGTWKVAAQTFCGLLKLEGTAPPACDNPKLTALPH